MVGGQKKKKNSICPQWFGLGESLQCHRYRQRPLQQRQKQHNQYFSFTEQAKPGGVSSGSIKFQPHPCRDTFKQRRWLYCITYFSATLCPTPYGFAHPCLYEIPNPRVESMVWNSNQSCKQKKKPAVCSSCSTVVLFGQNAGLALWTAADSHQPVE